MELRFIERNGKRILQMREDRLPFKDVPFVEQPTHASVEIGGQRGWIKVNALTAEIDTLRALLTDEEAKVRSLSEQVESMRCVSADWREECKRLGEKLKGKEKDAADWHKRYAALDKALLQRVGFRTRALVLETADDIFPELP